MAEWLCSGLQIRVPRFDSELRLHPPLQNIFMDDLVRAAMARWPNIPDIFGWLSLTATGQWRLHPDGKALCAETGHAYPAGESISNPQILAFINRNYSHDDSGRWFFQNGPQRVFARLDAAPLVFHTADDGNRLQAHTGAYAAEVRSWLLDAAGHLYVATDLGPGLVAGRDLMPVLDKFTLSDGSPPDLEQLMSRLSPQTISTLSVITPFQSVSVQAVPFHSCAVDQVETMLGFVRNPALGYA